MNILKGVLLVGIGASIYGMLATFVKMSYKEGFTTSEVTTAQFTIGFLGLLILNFFQTITSKKALSSPSTKEFKMLMLAGTSLGCTSLFYYISVQYINVSIAIVLLMQSVWFSVVVEGFITRKFPNAKKIIATLIVLIGTVLATPLHVYSTLFELFVSKIPNCKGSLSVAKELFLTGTTSSALLITILPYFSFSSLRCGIVIFVNSCVPACT